MTGKRKKPQSSGFSKSANASLLNRICSQRNGCGILLSGYDVANYAILELWLEGTSMIIESDEFYIGVVEPKDLNAVLAIYESNMDFVMHHTGRRDVTGA